MPQNAAESLLLFQLDHLSLIDVAFLIFPVIIVSILFWHFDYLKKRGWRNLLGISTTALFFTIYGISRIIYLFPRTFRSLLSKIRGITSF